MNKFSKIIIINEVLFLVTSLTLFYIGADTIPPVGFIGLVICILCFALVQYFYLKKFIIDLDNRINYLFIKNLFGFALLGLGIAISVIFINTLKINYFDFYVIPINMILVFLPIIFYGIYFYFFNLILLKVIK